VNLRNHQNLVEQIRKEIRQLENDNWTIHFTWVKAHNNYRNELADQLVKEATTSREAEIIYSKIPKSMVIRELKGEGIEEWQSEWNASTKGAIIKIILPYNRRPTNPKTVNGYKTIDDRNRTRHIEILLSQI
jgi:hypothetical protein